MAEIVNQPAYVVYKLSLEEQIFINNQLKGLGLRLSHASLLKYIQEHPGCAPKEVANQLNYQPASLTNMLKHLVAKGMIKRVVSPTDPRRRRLSVLEPGVEALQQVDKSFAKLDSLIGNIDQNSQQQLNNAWLKLKQANQH